MPFNETSIRVCVCMCVCALARVCAHVCVREEGGNCERLPKQIEEKVKKNEPQQAVK